MAISFVGSAVGSSSPATGTSVNVSGLGIAANDLILVAAAVGDTVNNGLAAPTEGGYTRVPGVAATLYANGTKNDTNLDLYYKIAAGSETAVSFAAVGESNASNAAVVMVFRGVDTTTPFDVNATTATGINTSNADPPSLDHLNPAGVWTVLAASTGHTGTATATFTFPTGYTTNAAQRAHNDTLDLLVGMGYKTAPADPEDPGALTAANIDTAADNAWAAVTMALRPAVATPTRGQVSWAEFEAPLKATRGQVSWAEFEVPLVPTRGQVSWTEFEVPIVLTRGQVSWAEFETPSAVTPARGQVSWAEFEIPSLTPTRGQVSWVELETPFVATRGRVSWGEFEVPTAPPTPTRGRVSWVEFEVPTTPTQTWVFQGFKNVGSPAKVYFVLNDLDIPTGARGEDLVVNLTLRSIYRYNGATLDLITTF